MEVFAHLVVAAVFKTVGRHVNRIASGFDSHTLPPKKGPQKKGGVAIPGMRYVRSIAQPGQSEKSDEI